jgi:hypothetical protein
MTTTKRFSTGGGFPNDNSPGRTIEFTLSYGPSDLFDPNPKNPKYNYRVEFSDPEDRAYICAMYGPPRDEEGLNEFVRALGRAYSDEAKDPANQALPVPPFSSSTQYGYDQRAAEEVTQGGIARGCLWAQQLGPDTNLAIDIANGPGANTYRAQAIDGDNRVVAEQSGSANDARNVSILGRRVMAGDGSDSGAGNLNRSAEGIDPTNLAQPTSLQQIDSNPVRRLVRVNGGTSPTMPTVPFDNQSSWGDRFGGGTASSSGIAPRNPNLPVSSPEAEGPIGLISGQPMRFFQLPIFDTRDRSGATGDSNRSTALEDLLWNGGRSQASTIDAGAPAAPFVSDRQNTFGNGSGAASPASQPGDALAPPMSAPQNPQGPLSLNDAYLEYLKRQSASQLLPASAADSSAPAAPLVPSDDANFSGGLLGRLMAVAGVDPLNPNQLAPPPQDDELRAFYRDNPAQPWTLQRWR